jgi:hypothetical protein
VAAVVSSARGFALDRDPGRRGEVRVNDVAGVHGSQRFEEQNLRLTARAGSVFDTVEGVGYGVKHARRQRACRHAQAVPEFWIACKVVIDYRSSNQ